MNNDYRNAVLSGLQRLMVLSLQGRPPMDSIQAVGEVWLDALHGCGDWNDPRQIQALIEAFKSAERELDKWPAPVEIIRRKWPVFDDEKPLPMPPKTPADQARIQQILNGLKNRLGVRGADSQKNINNTEVK